MALYMLADVGTVRRADNVCSAGAQRLEDGTQVHGLAFVGKMLVKVG